MQYKTIVLELLKERTELHEQLRLTRRLRPTLETCARELKASHESWKESLSLTKPGSEPSQIASEALEIAIKELDDGRVSPDLILLLHLTFCRPRSGGGSQGLARWAGPRRACARARRTRSGRASRRRSRCT